MDPTPKTSAAAAQSEYWLSMVRSMNHKVDFSEITSMIYDTIDVNNLEAVRTVLAFTPSVINEGDKDYQVTPLAFACVFDDTDILPRKRFQASDDRHQIIKFLINQGADVNTRCHVPAGGGARHLNVTLAHLAAWENNERLLQLLIERRARINEKLRPSEMTPLHLATCCNHPRICEILIQGGADLNEADADGNTALIIACGLGMEDIALFMLNQKYLQVDPHRANSRQWNALHAACLSGNKHVVTRLIKLGVNVNATTEEGYTPLDIALFSNRKNDLVGILEKQGATNGTELSEFAHVAPQFGRVSSLHIAAEKGDLKTMEKLIEKGYDVNIRDAVGRTPLDSAVLFGRVNSVKFLLERNADPNIGLPPSGAGPLLPAAVYGYEEIVRLLIDHGVNTDGTFLHGVVLIDPSRESLDYFEKKIRIARLLIKNNAPIDKTGSDGLTPYELACKGNVPLEILEVFRLQYDLLSAIQHSNVNHLKKCIEKGAILDCRSVKFKTPLQYAVSKGNEDIVKCLIEGGADVNYAPVGGVTALHYAAQFDACRIAIRLLQSGAAFDARTVKSGKTALELCRARNSATEAVLKWVESAFCLSPTTTAEDLIRLLKGVRNSRGQSIDEARQLDLENGGKT